VLEPLAAAVGDVLTTDRGAGAACDGSEPGVGGQVGAGAWRSLPRGSASKDGGGRDP